MLEIYKKTMIIDAHGFRQYAPSLWQTAVKWTTEWGFHKAVAFVCGEPANDHAASTQITKEREEIRGDKLRGHVKFFEMLLGIRHFYPDMRLR